MLWHHSVLRVLVGLIVISCLHPILAIESGTQAESSTGSLLVNSAQNGAINRLVADSNNGLLFCASADGSVNIYANGNDLVQHLQISTDPLIDVAVNANGKMAVLEKMPGNNFQISLWDWKNGVQIWNAALSDQALSMAFTARGNYLVLTLARWNSLLCIEADTGKVQPWLQEGFGIIDYALISSNEERVLSYHASSGSLSYHDLASGNEIKKLTTRPKLRYFQVIPDQSRSRACAMDGNKLIIVDLVTGKTLDGKDSGSGVSQILCDETNPTKIRLLGGSNSSPRLQSYTVDLKTGALVVAETEKINLKTLASAACVLQGKVFLGDKTGLVYDISTPMPTALSEHRLAKIVGLGFGEGVLYISSSAGFLRIQTDLMRSLPNSPLNLGQPTSRVISNLPAYCGAANLSEKEILLWDRSKSPRLYRYDIKLDAVLKSSAANANSYIRVKPLGEQILTVDSVGQVRKIEAVEFRVLFSHNTLGALTAESLGPNDLLIGKGSNNELDAALLRVNEKTGETVSLPGNDRAIFLSRFNPKSKSAYYLSSSQLNGKPMTALKKLSLEALSAPAQTILNFNGEDLGADIVVSPNGLTVFTSAGRSVISAWDEKNVWNLEETTRIPRDLRMWGKLLFAINLDGSLSVWDSETRKCLMDIFVLSSGNAFFLTRNASYGLILNASAARTAAEGVKDKKLIEDILRLPVRLRENGNSAIKPVQYPLQLP